jgi:hypothetical protein
MTDPVSNPGEAKRPRSQGGGEATTPEPPASSGRPTTRAFTRRPMPGAIDAGQPPAKPADPGMSAKTPTPTPTVPQTPLGGPTPFNKRTTAQMPAVRPPGSAPTVIMTPPVNPAGRITQQMAAIRPPGNAPTQLLPALPAAPPPLHVPGEDDAESLVKTRTANLRNEAAATRTSRLRPPSALHEGTAHIPSGAGGWTTDTATPTRVIGQSAPPPTRSNRPRYWMSVFVYAVLIVVVGGVSIWGSLFFWNMSHPRTGHNLDYAKANCPWLPSQATHISFRDTPMTHAAVFTIDEDSFLGWVKTNGYKDLGVQQSDGAYQPSLQHAITVVISPDEVVRGDASNGYWFEKRTGNLSGYTVAYDRVSEIAYFIDTRSLF